MSKRLQVLLPEDELRAVQTVAKRAQLTTAEWVRQSLRRAVSAEAGGDPKERLQVIARALEHAYPVGDVDQMLHEIESGYADDEHAVEL